MINNDTAANKGFSWPSPITKPMTSADNLMILSRLANNDMFNKWCEMHGDPLSADTSTRGITVYWPTTHATFEAND